MIVWLSLHGGRHIISDNNTRLTINSLRDYDAGVYKVNFTYSCEYPLPSNPGFVPVIFTVQENSLPVYDPLATVSTYYITDRSSRLFLNTSLQSQNIQRIYGDYIYWYKDNVIVRESNTSNITTTEQHGLKTDILELIHTESNSVAGVYMVGILARYNRSSNIWYEDYCLIVREVDYSYFYHTFGFSIWNVKSYRK